MRTVHVGIRKNAYFSVPKPGQVASIVHAVRIDTDGDSDVVDFLIGEKAVFFGFPGIEHFAAQRQDSLEFLVASHFGRTACRIAFNQKQFVAADVP